MQGIRIALACALAISSSAITLGLLIRLSESLGLVDHPNSRKLHVGSIPLVGGLSVSIGLLVGALWLGELSRFGYVLLSTALVLALLGALDDRYDLSVRARLLVQTGATLAVIAGSGVYIHTLGRLFGHELILGWTGIPFTVVAVIGIINAFNMMDGIDGLVGGLSFVSIGTILVYSSAPRICGPTEMLLLMGGAMLPYLAFNLGLIGRKVFLGDAGSMVLGYIFAWSLIDLSQSAPLHLSPVDALWCVALPVLDTLAVMYCRIRQGKSPFKPDRGHVHHIIMDTGISSRGTLVLLTGLEAFFSLFGMVIRSLGAEMSLLAFCCLVVVYIFMTARVRSGQNVRRDRTELAHMAKEFVAVGQEVAPVKIIGNGGIR